MSVPPVPDAVSVLVVDDSSTFRRLVTAVLRSAPDVNIAGEAADGSRALEAIAACRPGLVLLDVEMPVMDGLQTLRSIRARWPRLPVVMLSALTGPGAAVTVEALAIGATDYIVKPSGQGGPLATRAALGAELLEKIRAICPPRPPSAFLRPSPRPPARWLPAGPPAPAPAPAGSSRAVQLVAIGASTGGPNALVKVIGDLPATLPVPVVVVQHMPPTFTKLLAERLDRAAALQVAEATEPLELRAGAVFVATGGRHLVVERRGAAAWVAQSDSPPENSCRPAVDVLFRSAAATYGSGVLGVVLTGMGYDGQIGSEAVVATGGSVIAQDEESSVVWGMPGAVAKAGLADSVLPLEAIGREITARVTNPALAGLHRRITALPPTIAGARR